MPNHLSLLGIIHTALSILAIFAGFYALFVDGKMSPANGRGKLYIFLTVVTCLTSLPIMRFGHPTAGHKLAIIILVLLPIAIYAKQLRIFGKLWLYIQTILISTTLFLSFIPATVETLTRLPISQPLATGPNDPKVQMVLGIIVLLYAVGVIYQLVKIRAAGKKAGNTPGVNLT
jgi:hypothetical protein